MTRRFCIFLFCLLMIGDSLRADTTNAALTRAVVLENNVAYLRIGRVTGNLADEIQSAQRRWRARTISSARFWTCGSRMAMIWRR
jgi:hypothetical protein